MAAHVWCNHRRRRRRPNHPTPHHGTPALHRAAATEGTVDFLRDSLTHLPELKLPVPETVLRLKTTSNL